MRYLYLKLNVTRFDNVVLLIRRVSRRLRFSSGNVQKRVFEICGRGTIPGLVGEGEGEDEEGEGEDEEDEDKAIDIVGETGIVGETDIEDETVGEANGVIPDANGVPVDVGVIDTEGVTEIEGVTVGGKGEEEDEAPIDTLAVAVAVAV